METEFQNRIQNLRNDLLTRSFMENLDEILQNEKMAHNVYTFFTGLKQNKALYKLKWHENFEYIQKYYTTARKKYQGDNKLSKLSYGLINLYESAYFYIRKDDEESLNYLKNYNDIIPIDLGKVC